jgi:glutamate/tyrosine decarboxylase-like PLP-dependent enzyme
MAGGTQISIIAEQLAATINQNIGKWHLAPSISEIEKRVVQWAAEMINYPGQVGGVLVSGGSAANLAGLTVARNIFFEKLNIRKNGLFGVKPFTVYASEEVHGCIDKSLEQLGIGTNQLRKIETQEDFTINLEVLKQQIEQDIKDGFQPFCVVGNAGTVNTGAIDDLEALHQICESYKMWFHVDGAYGGLVAMLDSVKAEYKGIEKADSVALDFHKWLYQPFELGCVIVKNWETLRRAYFKKASYLDTQLEEASRLDFNEHYFQLSRNAKALKVWMSIKSYGMKALRAMIQKDIDLTNYLCDQVNQSEDFTLKSQANLAVACFQYTAKLEDQEQIIHLNQRLIPALEKDGRVFITGTKLNGELVLRACIINHRKQKSSIDYLLQVIRDVAATL